MSPEGRTTPAAWLPLAAVAVAALAIRTHCHLNTDVSWLLTLGERVLGGERAYADFIEVNPPASILLYLPAVLLAQASGIVPEAIVNAMVFAAVAASLALCGFIVRRAAALQPDELPAAGLVAAFALLILPDYTFAQREHFALIAMLPALCILAARADGGPVARPAALAAGIGAGIAVAIKPHFALALALPLALLLWRRRRDGWTAIIVACAPEIVAAGGVALLYAAIVAFAFPDFARIVLPMVLALYVGVGWPLGVLLTGPTTVLWATGAVLAVLLAWRRPVPALTAMLGLASLGFLAAALIQAKGWPYHGYPALALIAMTDALLLWQCWREAERSMVPAFATAAGVLWLCGAALWLAQNAEHPGLAAAVAAKAPPHPTIMAVGGEISLGHPLTRLVHGRWIGSACAQWMTANGEYLLARGVDDPARRAAIRRYMALDRALLRRDIVVGRPDVVLIDGPEEHARAMRDPVLKAALAPYRPGGTVDGVEILLRDAKATAAP